MTEEHRTLRAKLDEIHDGDTLRLVMDTCFDFTARKWLRLREVFAPELKDTGGPKTRIEVRRWLFVHSTHAAPSSWPYEVDTYRTSGDNDKMTLGRYVAVVRCAGCQQELNAALRAFLALHPTWSRGTGAPVNEYEVPAAA